MEGPKLPPFLICSTRFFTHTHTLTDTQREVKDMSSASQAMLNQSLFEEQDMIISSQLGIFPFQTNFASLPLGCNQLPLKTLAAIPPSLAADSPLITLSDQSIITKQKEDFTTNFAGVPQILSLQKSASNYWYVKHIYIEISSYCIYYSEKVLLINLFSMH